MKKCLKTFINLDSTSRVKKAIEIYFTQRTRSPHIAIRDRYINIIHNKKLGFNHYQEKIYKIKCDIGLKRVLVCSHLQILRRLNLLRL